MSTVQGIFYRGPQFFAVVFFKATTPPPSVSLNLSISFIRDCGHEQPISKWGENPVFAERDKKQTMIDLRGISTNWF